MYNVTISLVWMSENTSHTHTPSTEESTSTSSSTDNEILLNSKHSKKKRNEAEILQIETSAHLSTNSNLLHSGSRILRSQKTLVPSESEEAIRREIEYDRLLEQEISLRPLRAGQTTQERHPPARQDFEYIYKNIDQLTCQVWASNLEPWLDFVKAHKLYEDLSFPILDKDGLEYTNLTFSLETLLKLPTNKKYLKKKRKNIQHNVTDNKQIDGTHTNTSAKNCSSDSGSSSSSSSSFVVIPPTNTLALNLTTGDNNQPPVPNPDLFNQTSTGATPTNTPNISPLDSNPTTPDSGPNDNMATLKERSIFFPSEKFDGRNKALTKQHWQTFEDFCEQQKLYIEDRGANAAATADQIKPFFKMTLTDLARAWLETQTFDSAKDLKDKFLTNFSPYGKSHRQWISKWSELKFNPDIDNIDEFLEKFEDLAKLNNLGDDYKLHAFKIAMPKEVEIHLRSIENLQDCYQTAKELLTIVQTPLTNRMSTLSLAQSRSPSPQARARSPSPRRSTPPTPDRSRPRTNPRNNPSFQGFRQYPGTSRPQSIMRRPFRNMIGRGRGQTQARQIAQMRPRSLNRGRSFAPRCFNCNMLGHIARNCFTRARVPSRDRANFPRRFTPNFRKNQRQGNQRPQQSRVRFQDEVTNRYNRQDRNRYRYDAEYMNHYTDAADEDQIQDQYPGHHLN